jgi:predicted enzyme involved in methoxymalonyl-ACP biosynthesis
VIGLDVENRVFDAILTAKATAGTTTFRAHVVPTDANFVCREVFARAGFTADGDAWVRTLAVPAAV